MKNKVLICINHELTDIQKQELVEVFKCDQNFHYLKNENQKLFNNLSNCSENTGWLKNKAKELVDYIIKNSFDYVVLPIGSPAFLWCLAQYVEKTMKNVSEIKFLFAHTKRVAFDTVDENGKVKKVSFFEHVCFIVFPDNNTIIK